MLNNIRRFFGFQEFTLITKTLVGNNTSQEDDFFKTMPIYQTNVKNLKIQNGHYDGAYLKKGGILEPNGKGVLTFPDGATFKGDFKDGKRDGKGVMINAEGDKHEGDFKDNKAHGKGVVTYANGAEYNGDFKYGQRNGQGVMIYASGAKYEGEFKDGLKHGQGVTTYPNSATYRGEFAGGDVFTNVDNKQQKQNKTKTLVFQSSENRKKPHSSQWGYDRFTNEDELVTRHYSIKDTQKVIDELDKLVQLNEGESKKFKLVFDQHGGIDGLNNIGVDAHNAKQILQILYKKGYNDITISDLSCHGGTAFHFKRISQEFVNTNPEIYVTIRASAEDRLAIPCHSNNGTKIRTIAKDGQVLKREKTVYDSYDVGEGENPGCLTPNLSRPTQPHHSYKNLETSNQSTAYNRI